MSDATSHRAADEPDEEAKVVAMGLFIEQCVRDNRLDLIPPGEFIPPRWMVEDDPDPTAKMCPVCHKPTDKLYGGEGRYVVRCFECWQEPHPDDSSPA